MNDKGYSIITSLKDQNILSLLIKLKQDSKHCFRLDLFKEQNIDLALSVLEDQSDNIFQGYPYGLIMVDKLAKVSEQEKQLLNYISYLNCDDKAKFLNLIGQSEVHDIIDMINKKWIL